MQATAHNAKASAMRRQRLIPAVAGAILAVTAATAFAATHSFTLRIRKNVHVTNAPNAAFAAKPVDTHETVAVGPAGYAVYTFQGETTHHFICHKTNNTNTNCWGFWPPLFVASAKGLSKPTGIRGRLGTVRRRGHLQLTLNGKPLYYFAPDIMSGNKRRATGDELNTFGSIWHIVAIHASGTSQTSGSSSSGTGGTPSYPYPPGG
jgi:predicted lipoprotein with Yx(FWY)xxD motif